MAERQEKMDLMIAGAGADCGCIAALQDSLCAEQLLTQCLMAKAERRALAGPWLDSILKHFQRLEKRTALQSVRLSQQHVRRRHKS